MKIVGKDMVHLLGTDAHSAVGKRITSLSAAYKMIEKKYGHDKVDMLMSNARNLITGEYI